MGLSALKLLLRLRSSLQFCFDLAGPELGSFVWFSITYVCCAAKQPTTPNISPNYEVDYDQRGHNPKDPDGKPKP